MSRSKAPRPIDTASPADLQMPFAVSAGAARSPQSSNLGISKAHVDPEEGYRLPAADYRYERHLSSYLKPQASSLKSPQKGQESELTITPIQLLSCGVHERCMPLKSKEDSENAVGIAPMA